jgi:autophagy-related protein 9
LSDPIEDEEEASPEATQQSEGITSSGGMANDSNLGESWKTTQKPAPWMTTMEMKKMSGVAAERALAFWVSFISFRRRKRKAEGLASIFNRCLHRRSGISMGVLWKGA